MSENITVGQALQFLINAVHLGQKRGAWNLSEASTLQTAVSVIEKVFGQKQKVEMKTEKESNEKESLPPIVEEVSENDIEEIKKVTEPEGPMGPEEFN